MSSINSIEVNSDSRLPFEGIRLTTDSSTDSNFEAVGNNCDDGPFQQGAFQRVDHFQRVHVDLIIRIVRNGCC